MRILIYSYNYAPEPIGIAPLMTELAEGLVKRGHEVRVITGLPNYPERRIYPEYRGKLYIKEQKKGVTIQRCWLWIRPKPGALGLLDRVLQEVSFVVTSFPQALLGWRPDVILVTIPSLPICVPAALLGWLWQRPVVLNVQDILPEAAVRVGLIKNKLLIRIFEILEKFAYLSSTKISVIADGFEENLRSKGVPEEKLELIPNWVDVNFIRPLPKKNNTFRTAYKLDGKFVVLYAGNIALTQGLETVIRAAVKLRHVPDIVFVIVGEEGALERLHKRCQDWGADNVLLRKFVRRRQLPTMLAAADIGLVVQKSNVVSFNMPSKIQVLLASGRAIVASVPVKGTAARAIQQSGGGIIVPPEDPHALASAILELYNNPDEVTMQGNKGRDFAIKKYAFEQALNSYEKLLYRCTESPVSMLINQFEPVREGSSNSHSLTNSIVPGRQKLTDLPDLSAMGKAD